jgi:hypothetical protein
MIVTAMEIAIGMVMVRGTMAMGRGRGGDSWDRQQLLSAAEEAVEGRIDCAD